MEKALWLVLILFLAAILPVFYWAGAGTYDKFFQNAYGQQVAPDEIIQGCEVEYMTDFMYNTTRINVVHEPGSSTVERLYDDESTQQITLIEPLKDVETETTNIGFETNSIGHMVVKLVITHSVDKIENRQMFINYQSGGREMERTILEYTGTKYCRVFDMYIKEEIIPLTDEQILETADKVNQVRDELLGEKLDDNTQTSFIGNLINGISAAIVSFFGIFLWIKRHEVAEIVRLVISDYKTMRQEYINMVQTTSVEEMHKALEHANFVNDTKNTIQYFNTVAEKKIDEFKAILNLILEHKPKDFVIPKELKHEIKTEEPVANIPILENIPKQLTNIKEKLIGKAETKTTVRQTKFKESMLDKMKDMEPVEKETFLHDAYTELYPKTPEKLKEIGAELNEKLYIIKHLMNEIKSTRSE